MYAVLNMATTFECVPSGNYPFTTEPIVVDLCSDEGCVGMIPVFDSIESARKVYPNSDIFEIRKVPK